MRVYVWIPSGSIHLFVVFPIRGTEFTFKSVFMYSVYLLTTTGTIWCPAPSGRPPLSAATSGLFVNCSKRALPCSAAFFSSTCWNLPKWVKPFGSFCTHVWISCEQCVCFALPLVSCVKGQYSALSVERIGCALYALTAFKDMERVLRRTFGSSMVSSAAFLFRDMPASAGVTYSRMSISDIVSYSLCLFSVCFSGTTYRSGKLLISCPKRQN